MKSVLVRSLTNSFEAHAHQTEGGVAFWLARDIQHLLSDSKWDNFLNVISKVKTACEVSGHFADVGKMLDFCSCCQRGATRSCLRPQKNLIGHRHAN